MPVTVLSLRVSPGASKDAIVGWHGNALKIRVCAAPENGKANDAVIALLSNTLGLPRRAIILHSGHASRSKRIRIEGLTLTEITARLGKPTTH